MNTTFLRSPKKEKDRSTINMSKKSIDVSKKSMNVSKRSVTQFPLLSQFALGTQQTNSNDSSSAGDCVLMQTEENEIIDESYSPRYFCDETVPDVATSTCKGQKLLVDIIDQIPYETGSKFTY